MATTWKEEACGRFIAAKAAVGWERVEGTARLFEQRRHKGRRDEDEDGADSQRQKRPLGCEISRAEGRHSAFVRSKAPQGAVSSLHALSRYSLQGATRRSFIGGEYFLTPAAAHTHTHTPAPHVVRRSWSRRPLPPAFALGLASIVSAFAAAVSSASWWLLLCSSRTALLLLLLLLLLLRACGLEVAVRMTLGLRLEALAPREGGGGGAMSVARRSLSGLRRRVASASRNAT